MLNGLRNAWRWFVDGLVEAALWCAAGARRRRPVRMDVREGGASLVDAGGTPLGSLLFGGGAPAFAPDALGRRLAGAAVDVVVPPAWLTRRDLEPVAVASRPFLDAFVRHQIERVTPWRVGDTHYRIVERPLPEDAGRLAVAVVVVPRRLVAPALAALDAAKPGVVRLRSAEDPETAITVGGARPAALAAARRGVVGGLGCALLAVVSLVAVLQWQAGAVRDDIDGQDRVLAERKAVLARQRRASDPAGEAGAKLRALRDARPLAVGIIDALAKALPDSAHLTALAIDRDRVTVAGVSTDPSALVPALETSGAFAEVAFGAATTTAEAGAGDRFGLEMKALPPRSDHAGPPNRDPVASLARVPP